VKFDLLWRRARELGATRLATGHYARIGTDPATGHPCLRAAHDVAKDQSYFLFTLGADELRRTLFPIGDSTKAEVRAEARRLGLPVADKPESMEVCFVPRGDAAGFVAGRAPDALRPGAIVDGDGTVLGVHPGIHAFTVGQRRGLGVGGGPRRYVRAIDAASGTVTVAGAGAMRGRGLRATDVRWSAGTPPAAGTAVGCAHPPSPSLVAAQLTQCGESDATVAFDADGPLVTPGQAGRLLRRRPRRRRRLDRGRAGGMSPRVAIVTLGCKVNSYDTATDR
jgi:tRNA-specific 2-thiouridylase